MDQKIAVASVTCATPGVQCESKSMLNRSRGLVPAGMPTGLPLHELVGDVEFFGINLRARVEQIDVLFHEVEGVHSQLRRKIIERAHGEHAHLGMVRSTPSARRTNVVHHAYILLLLVGYLPDIWDRKRTWSRWPARSPRI